MVLHSVGFATRWIATVAFAAMSAPPAIVTATAVSAAGPDASDEFSKLESELVAAHEAYLRALSESQSQERATGSSATGSSATGKTLTDGRPPLLKQMDDLAEDSVSGPHGLAMTASTLYWSLVIGSDESPARFARLAKHFPDASLTAEHLANLELAYTSGGDPTDWVRVLEEFGNRTSNSTAKHSARFISALILLAQGKLKESRQSFEALTEEAEDPEIARRAKGFVFEIDHLQIGMPAPDFEVHTLDGRVVSLKSLRGKPVLIDFWATWCPGCIAEIPTLKRARARFANRFEILGVSLDDDSDALRRAVKALNPPGIQAWDFLDGKFPTALKYNVEGLPTWYLIGPNGLIRARDPFGEALIPAIESALQPDAAKPSPKLERSAATD